MKRLGTNIESPVLQKNSLNVVEKLLISIDFYVLGK